MGGAISSPPQVESVRNLKDVQLKQLPDAIEEAIFIHEKFPLIIDPTEQAARLLDLDTAQRVKLMLSLNLLKVLKVPNWSLYTFR